MHKNSVKLKFIVTYGNQEFLGKNMQRHLAWWSTMKELLAYSHVHVCFFLSVDI
jgi:hypothetical protein